ncbi:MAG: hypothetical protein M3P85_10750 [Actinomycetota bacterium]|nr:hypothetical protein [Actinomycetota bacterium]
MAQETENRETENTSDAPVLQKAPGTELIGEFEGSGYREPQYLARTGDGQVVQLTELLHVIADEADGQKTVPEVASAVSDRYGKEVSPAMVGELADAQLRPPGVLSEADGSTRRRKRRDPVLALRLRKGVISPETVQRAARPLTVLFWPPVVAVSLVAFVALVVWLFGVHGISDALRGTLTRPGVFLLVFALAFLSAGFHELGHAAACLYGGAKPGEMGAGVYLAWPAFYTDVTDAYRLSRAARLRTDLGGIYFNAVFSLAVAGAYAATRFEPLLLVILAQQFQILQQLLPLVRLDGYYILSDLTGVPDLFARMRGILVGLLPWREPDAEALALKPRVRVTVTAWVVVTVAVLTFALGRVLVQLPGIYASSWTTFRTQMAALWSAVSEGSVLEAVAATVQGLTVLLAPAGLSYVLVRLARRTTVACARKIGGWPRGDGPEPGGNDETGPRAILRECWYDLRYRRGLVPPQPVEAKATVAPSSSRGVSLSEEHRRRMFESWQQPITTHHDETDGDRRHPPGWAPASELAGVPSGTSPGARTGS